jgi:hypothetical protein
LARSASAAALALHLAVCSILILSPTSARACVHPPPPAAAAVEAKEEEDDDEEWEAALQQWKSKTYALSVPLRVVALRGSFPPTWIKVCSFLPPTLQGQHLLLLFVALLSSSAR